MADERLVLVVDDEPSLLAQYSLGLEMMGIAFIALSNAQEAIQRINEGGVTEVVTDGLDGEWYRVVQSAQAAGIKTITLVTGTAELATWATQLGIGFVDKRKLSLRDLFLQES